MPWFTTWYHAPGTITLKARAIRLSLQVILPKSSQIFLDFLDATLGHPAVSFDCGLDTPIPTFCAWTLAAKTELGYWLQCLIEQVS